MVNDKDDDDDDDDTVSIGAGGRCLDHMSTSYSSLLFSAFFWSDVLYFVDVCKRSLGCINVIITFILHNQCTQKIRRKIFVSYFVKLYNIVNNILDSATLQKSLDDLANWSEKWQLKLSVPKCRTLHLGQGNMGNSYNISNVELPNVCVVKDFGIIIDSRLDYSDHIQIIITKAHQRACFILRRFKSN